MCSVLEIAVYHFGGFNFFQPQVKALFIWVAFIGVTFYLDFLGPVKG